MTEFRLSPEAEAELDDIWLYIARESSSIQVATREVEKITEHFWLLAQYPYLGRSRDKDLRPGLLAATSLFIASVRTTWC
jgi:toxin ParE1/3/4